MPSYGSGTPGLVAPPTEAKPVTQSRTPRKRAAPGWRFVFVVLGLVSVPVYYLLPRGTVAQAAVFLAVSMALPMAILIGIRLHRRLEVKLQHHAFFDALTDLPNRALYTNRLTQALGRAERRSESLTVLIADLDGFKAVNDSLGHAAGDTLLVAVGARLRDCTREIDTVARLGGDEFAILMEDAAAEDGIRLAERIRERLRAPFVLEGKEQFVDASIGIAEAHPPTTMDQLLRNADAAMYTAKRGGRGRHEVYRSEHHDEVARRFALSAELRGAIARSELVLHYQPVVTLTTGDLVGIEALVRWNHPERGLLPPGEFVPFAEETGLVLDLDRWVLAAACRQAKAWQERFPGREPLVLHVNISARQLHAPGIMDDLAGSIRDAALEPGTLTLEITEGDLVQDTEAALAGLRRLKEAGVRLAIDDFGVGFSSLNYLRRLPVDVVKIDRSFVTGVATDAVEWSLARGIIRLVHSLGLETLAEGIETAEQVAHLRALECRQGQGFFFGHPAPPEAITERLEREAASRTA
jgi:diguanylate cyclase (GGDEF)-like protein